jgi:hypothetical protein
VLSTPDHWIPFHASLQEFSGVSGGGRIVVLTRGRPFYSSCVVTESAS